MELFKVLFCCLCSDNQSDIFIIIPIFALIGCKRSNVLFLRYLYHPEYVIIRKLIQIYIFRAKNLNFVKKLSKISIKRGGFAVLGF